jgi:hypothetical protein
VNTIPALVPGNVQAIITTMFPAGANRVSVPISDVAPGLSPACTALKDCATFKLGHCQQVENKRKNRTSGLSHNFQ